MFTVDVDSEAVQKLLTRTMGSIAALGDKVPAELTAWQTEDMGRKHPDTNILELAPHELGGPHVLVSVMTRLWPLHVRTRQQRKASPGRPGAINWWLRPILRRELYDKLVLRMRTLLGTVVP